MKRKIFVIAFILMMSFVSFLFAARIIKVEAVTVSTIKFHYYRYDETYSNYWVWFWTESTGGKSYQIKKDSNSLNGYDYSATITLQAGTESEKLGVIFVKTKGSTFSWDGADQTDDLYFYITEDSIRDGVSHIFYAQGDEAVTTNDADAQKAKLNKFLSLSFSGTKTIKYSATNSISNVVVKKNGTAIGASKPTAKEGTITLDNAIDFDADYTVSAKVKNDEANDVSVSFEGIYSSTAFGDAFNYSGDDLGANYTKAKTTFKLWAPISKSINVKLYTAGHSAKYGNEAHPGVDEAYMEVPMTKGEKGVWSAEVEEDLDGVYYMYEVHNANSTNEVVDPYAKTTGLNGERGMVVNFSADNAQLNPEKWAETGRAESRGNNAVDSIIYEAHVRDLTADASWGGKAEWSGTFLGLSQRGTTYTDGTTTVSTGLDHIIELGVTHVHLLPVMDSSYVNEMLLQDETYKNQLVDGIYNWGYMTKHFFTLEGAYSTDPYDGYARMNEYKTMIQTMHENDISVVMDVVYNHSDTAGNINFNKIVPKYYHRTSMGKFTNGSGCGNEMASERYMVRKLIVDSAKFFAAEYKIDGLRFDLMALEDVTTMNAIYDAVSKIDSKTIIYGEPWTGDGSIGGNSAYDGGTYNAASKKNLSVMPNIGAFSDISREGIRGGNDAAKNVELCGWVLNGNNIGYSDRYDKTVWGIMGGANYHNGANTSSGDHKYQQTSPNQIVNYASCHDNHALYDQMKIGSGWSISSKNTDIMNAVSQALGVVLTSQGVAFMEAGSEIGRTKRYQDPVTKKYETSHNSYNMGDLVNAIKWDKKITNINQFNAVRDFVAVRKEHKAFRQTTYDAINRVLASKNSTLWYEGGTIIAYRIQDTTDDWKDIYVIHANSAAEGKTFSLPSGSWKVAASNNPNHKFNSTFTSSTKLMKNETVILVNSQAKLKLSTKTTEGGGQQEVIDPDAITISELKVSGNSVSKPEQSTAANDLKYVKNVCGEAVSNMVEEVGELVGLAASEVFSSARAFAANTADKYESTVAIYNEYKKIFDLYKLAKDGNEFAKLVPGMPKETMANLYYNLNRER